MKHGLPKSNKLRGTTQRAHNGERGSSVWGSAHPHLSPATHQGKVGLDRPSADGANMNIIMDGITSLQDRVSRSMDINTSTLSGAIDVVVVEQEDGSLRSTPFHVR